MSAIACDTVVINDAVSVRPLIDCHFYSNKDKSKPSVYLVEAPALDAYSDICPRKSDSSCAPLSRDFPALVVSWRNIPTRDDTGYKGQTFTLCEYTAFAHDCGYW